MSVEIFDELVKKQIKNIDDNKRLKYNDLKRISKYVNASLFDMNKCCLWSGYITNIDHNNKGIYVNFYFEGKKIALHRLLYINYIGHLDDNDYLKFSCDNKGKCCNIYHLHKFKYIPRKTIENKEKDENKPKPEINIINETPVNFIVNFD